LKDVFDAFAKEAVKQGTAIPGMMIAETEFLSVRTADGDKERRKVVIE
jgi:hypothetical protein